MVTANNARFKERNIMNDSYVERYIQAKKRQEVTPKCLFGSPRRSETDQFLLQHDADQMKETKEVYEKYDLTEIPDSEEKDNLFPQFESTSDSMTFQAKIVTERSPPPGDNLFSPIEKIETSVAGNDTATDYWQTSKRRRSSSNVESSADVSSEGDHNDQDQRNVNSPDGE